MDNTTAYHYHVINQKAYNYIFALYSCLYALLIKAMYFFIMLTSIFLMFAMTFKRVQKQLYVYFRDFKATCKDLRIEDEKCFELTGYLAVHKVSFVFVTFYA